MRKNKFWEFKAKKEELKAGELMLYGDISSTTWWGDEVTPKDFKKELDNLGDIDTLSIYINSGGGDVFAAQAILSMLKRHKAEKNVYIDGLAASAATFFIGAGKVYMPKNAMMMVHNPSTMTWGNAADMRKMADDLDKIRESMLSIYREKTGMTDEEIISLLDAETWMTAEEAIEKGFADELEESKEIAASMSGEFLMFNNQKFDLERYKNAPKVEETPKEELKTNEDRAEDTPEPVSDSNKTIIQAQQEEFRKLKLKLIGGI